MTPIHDVFISIILAIIFWVLINIVIYHVIKAISNVKRRRKNG